MSDSRTQTAADQKSALRQAALSRRDAMSAAERQLGAEAIAGRAFPVQIPPGAVVSGFMPMKTEINPLPLMKRLAAAGASLALPIVEGRGKPLTMRAWTFGAPLEAGVWGIRQPPATAPEVFPDILLVPLATFDRRGYRIGYGAGYYDMTIARLRAMKPVMTIGVAFATQECAAVPVDPWDERLAFVLTEREVIVTDGGSG
jgi:5-formyltetrahydrofolate cyclo-ligase